MKIEGINKNNELAKLFGVAASTVSTWKKRGTIPYTKILSLCEKKGWNYQEILTGEQNKSIYSAHETNEKYQVPPDPIDQIMRGFAQLFKDQKKEIEKSHDLCNKVLRKFSDLEKKFKKMQPGAARRLNAGNAEAGSGSHAHYGDATRKKES